MSCWCCGVVMKRPSPHSSYTYWSPNATYRPPCCRPRWTPRWYAESRPRTSSGERRWKLVVLPAFSTPPGTYCACGTRLGSPDRVEPPTGGRAAAAAADQPASAAVRQSTGPPLPVPVLVPPTVAAVAAVPPDPVPDGSEAPGWPRSSRPWLRNQAASISLKIGISTVESCCLIGGGGGRWLTVRTSSSGGRPATGCSS